MTNYVGKRSARVWGRINVMKKITNLREWPKSVPQPYIEEILKRKKKKREEKIRDTQSKIDKIRNKS